MVVLQVGSSPLDGLDKAIPFPLICILVSQILTSKLNSALHCGLIPGFNGNINSNFNHLIYGDDLVRITRTSRCIACKINLFLNSYGHLISQHLNVNKSAVYFPCWFNKRVQASICSILHINSASFPFKYLGILISPMKLVVSIFNHMINKIRHTCAHREHSKLSMAVKSLLINSSLFSILNYNLSIYPIPDSVLNEINKVVRDFLWHKSGNIGKGIHVVRWSYVTKSKREGGLAVKNLSIVKHSIFAKHVFRYLNQDNVLWEDILLFKYGYMNFWRNPTPVNCSTFFRGFCVTANILKPCYWINSLNPGTISLLHDPWCFDIPLAYKPTFINIDLDLNALNISDFINNNWDYQKLRYLFGNINFDIIDILWNN